ncbi:MAG: response regulator [Candidatus Lindowbacteria bacterium]|nr:response regulator [Candidatus Lindowbacteria bacterium]
MDVMVVASSEHSIQESLRMLLGEEYIIVHARTLPQLLNALVEHPVDVVIIDEFLENTDCLTIFQQVRSLSPEITCIMLAVQANSEAAREMRATGIYDIVAKPFDRDVLRASVARAIERRRLIEKLAAAQSTPAAASPAREHTIASSADPSTIHRREMLDSLRKFLRAVADVFAPEKLYSLILDAVVEMFTINRACLLLYNEETEQIVIKAVVGLDHEGLNGYRMVPWTGLIAWLRKRDQILNLDDPDAETRSEEMLAIKKELELLRARICVPLKEKGRLTGVLVLGKRVTGRRLSNTELEFLYLLSQQIATIIENAKRQRAVVDPATKSLMGLSSSLLTDASGKPIGAVILFTDLSTVKRRAGSETDETWQRCALCMAQEIKNPLVAIRTFTQLFPESYADEKFRNEFSEIALNEIDKLDGVVNRLLRFSEPLEVQAEPGDIHSLLEQEVSQLADSAKKQNVVVKKDFDTSNGGLPFDRNLLSEALTQVFQNALEAMPQGGTLTIATRKGRYPDPQLAGKSNGVPPGPVTEISIADTGVGIPAEEMPNLFKPFHTSKVKGMGLGLSISRRIIASHKGDIMISSEPNKGTVVKIVLPQGAACNAKDSRSR